jgi:hypothetical protein
VIARLAPILERLADGISFRSAARERGAQRWSRR